MRKYVCRSNFARYMTVTCLFSETAIISLLWCPILSFLKIPILNWQILAPFRPPSFPEEERRAINLTYNRIKIAIFKKKLFRDTYLEPCQRSFMELFWEKILFSQKSSSIDVSQSPKYTSVSDDFFYVYSRGVFKTLSDI